MYLLLTIEKTKIFTSIRNTQETKKQSTTIKNL